MRTAAGTRPAPAARRRPDAALAPPLLCLALAIVSLLGSSALSYDPWAWLVWGREIGQLALDTRDGPSWKPLPVAFTTLFAPAGDAAPALWLVVARTGAAFAVVLAFRLARRAAGTLAGVAAAAALCSSDDWLRGAALGSSEGLLVALVLGAVERHARGRADHAFGLAVGAALLRPEVWPFLGLYALWLCAREPRRRALVAGGLLLVPLLWLGPELWGSGEALRAAERANRPNPDSAAWADSPALAVLGNALWMLVAPFLALFAGGAVWSIHAALTRGAERSTAALSLGALAWTALVALMTEAGFAGNRRYLVVAAALAAVVAGVALGRAAREIGGRLPVARRRAAMAVAAGVPMAVALAVAVPQVARDARGVAYEEALDSNLDAALGLAGGRERALGCGQPFTGPFQVPAVAWRLRVHTGQVGYEPRAPGVVLRAVPRRGVLTPPTIPPPAAPFTSRGAAGPWEVWSACRTAAPA